MADSVAGVYGAKVQSWSKSNPRNVLSRIMAQHPNASEAELAEVFWQEIQVNEECLRVIAMDYWFPNNYRSLVGSSPAGRKIANKKKSVLKAAIQESIQREANKLLLDMEMPNGKLLRNATGGDCAKAGGWFLKIAKKVRSTQVVGKVLSENEVRNLYGG